jgi:hypothetical protein
VLARLVLVRLGLLRLVLVRLVLRLVLRLGRVVWTGTIARAVAGFGVGLVRRRRRLLRLDPALDVVIVQPFLLLPSACLMPSRLIAPYCIGSPSIQHRGFTDHSVGRLVALAMGSTTRLMIR